ncbi:MAG: hypothetical protein DRP83_06730 [Planctomycetota bacterium]|nr:MAG: hypothetical protein DRP83_06730 [Planctomycetota bacterium]
MLDLIFAVTEVFVDTRVLVCYIERPTSWTGKWIGGGQGVTCWKIGRFAELFGSAAGFLCIRTELITRKINKP